MIHFELKPFRDAWPIIEDEWRRLFRATPDPCIFYHPLFLRSTAVLPAPDQPTHLLLGTDGERLVFGLPVTGRTGFAKEIAFYSGGRLGFDHLAPLDRSPGAQASRVFAESLGDALGADLLSAGGADGSFARLLAQAHPRAFKRPFFRCPYLALPGEADSLLRAMTRKFRSNIHRGHRNAAAQGIEFRVVAGDGDGHYTLQDAFRNLLTVHHARAEMAARTSGFARPVAIDFYSELCRAAGSDPGLILFFEAVQEGRVIGSLCGFRHGPCFYYFQSGFLPEYSTYSIGTLVIYQAMLWSIERK